MQGPSVKQLELLPTGLALPRTFVTANLFQSIDMFLCDQEARYVCLLATESVIHHMNVSYSKITRVLIWHRDKPSSVYCRSNLVGTTELILTKCR